MEIVPVSEIYHWQAAFLLSNGNMFDAQLKISIWMATRVNQVIPVSFLIQQSTGLKIHSLHCQSQSHKRSLNNICTNRHWQAATMSQPEITMATAMARITMAMDITITIVLMEHSHSKWTRPLGRTTRVSQCTKRALHHQLLQPPTTCTTTKRTKPTIRRSTALARISQSPAAPRTQPRIRSVKTYTRNRFSSPSDPRVNNCI